MRCGHRTSTILQHSLKWLSALSLVPSNVKGHGKVRTVPETSAKEYGAWCIPVYAPVYMLCYSEIFLANSQGEWSIVTTSCLWMNVCCVYCVVHEKVLIFAAKCMNGCL